MSTPDDSSPDKLQQRFRHALLDQAHPLDWQNPKPASTYNLVILGAGPAGITAARAAAVRGAKVALIERDLLGGDRLNVGCVPSKSILRTARWYADTRNAWDFGARAAHTQIDFAGLMQRMRRIQARLSRADSARRLAEAGVDVFFGAAHFADARHINVAGAGLRFERALIATGARPRPPSIAGLGADGYFTNENIFNLNQLPRRLLVIGGGPLGCELAQAFCRFGSQVIIAQNEPKFLPREERDAAQILASALVHDGIDIHLSTSVVSVRVEGAQKVIELERDGDKMSITVDEILAGIGRAPNVEELNLEAAGVRYDTDRGVHVDDHLRTSNRRVYAAGDVCLEYKFTHAAVASARIAVRNALFPGARRWRNEIIPWCTYTDPEIAHVGWYVQDARAQRIPVRTFTTLMHDVDRAVTDGEEHGFVKLHVRAGTDRILGATVVARHAGEMIDGLSLAIRSGIGLRDFARVIHSYPTQAEAIKMAADAYMRSRVPAWLRFLSARWLALRRGAAS